jgi:mannan endo-1,4-beta-mannosidase
MALKNILFLAASCLAASAPTLPLKDSSRMLPDVSSVTFLFPPNPILTKQIRSTYLEPNLALYARNSYVYREGTSLKLLGEPWTAEGANVYWLGLDENVIPPKGEPFYAPLNASYPTKGRTTEVMNTLVMMGATLIRAHTLGVSVGNPLSLSPSLGVYNDAAFEPMDWAVFQARQHGLRIMVPLTDNYVSFLRPLPTVTSISDGVGLLPRWKVHLPPLGRLQHHWQPITPATGNNVFLHQPQSCHLLRELHPLSAHAREPLHWSFIC